MTRDELDMLVGIPLHTLDGVREMVEHYPVELRRDARSGRLLLVASNEGQNNETRVDLWDLLDWLTQGPPSGRVEDGFALRR